MLRSIALRHARSVLVRRGTANSGNRGGETGSRAAAFVRRSTSSTSSSSNPREQLNLREHPPFPRVGVAAVLFKPRPRQGQPREEPSVLLIQRAKPPNEGLWSFPGGALELGEGVVEGAERELTEEAPGLRFEKRRSVAGALAGGVAFAAADSIHYDKEGAPPRFHWAIVEVAAVAASAAEGTPVGDSPPATADDASAARWVGALSELRSLEEDGVVTPGCARVAAEAVERFGSDLGVSRK